MKVTAYCLRCKKKTKIEDAHVVKLKNKIRSVDAMKGICQQCGLKYQRF